MLYIACLAENAVVAGVLYTAVFAIASIVLTSFMGIVPGALLKSPKLVRTFQVICRAVLVLFGLRLFYYVLNVVT